LLRSFESESVSVEPEVPGCERSVFDPGYEAKVLIVVLANQAVGLGVEEVEFLKDGDDADDSAPAGDDAFDGITAVVAGRAACGALGAEEDKGAGEGVMVMTGVAVEVMMPEPSFLIFGLLRCRWNWRMSSWTEASSR